MPMTTFLFPGEHLAPTTNETVNDALSDVRKATGEDWRVAEYITVARRWFRRVEFKHYELLVAVGSAEFQVINFYRPDREALPMGSINAVNSAGYVVAFLYGLLAGEHNARRRAACASGVSRQEKDR